ncbi:hypothetical protein [Oleiharenicola sp. Vm1]|uniref:hypothetical protein n=1 Tax=Oleiharenicola sp. Vm1 TaxID=3398393 RepID=UPI0039F5F7E5
MRSTQEFIHWLEQGAGKRGLVAAALVVGALLLTSVFSWKQFHGPPNEWTLQQVELGRQLAQGQGFTTRVNYPQTYAVMKARGMPLSETQLYPELHHAPSIRWCSRRCSSSPRRRSGRTCRRRPTAGRRTTSCWR